MPVKDFQKKPTLNTNILILSRSHPDNNRSERAIKNDLVKQKISSQYEANQKADEYAVNRSVIDSIVKRKINTNSAILPQLNTSI